MSVNKVILVGRLGKDPELRYTPSGTAVVTFTLATDERYKDKEGNQQSKTEWHNIVAWRQLAEICGKFLHKGKQVYIEGKIQTRSYDDRDGNKRYITEIVTDQMQMLGSREDSQGGGQQGGYGGGQSSNNNNNQYGQSSPQQQPAQQPKQGYGGGQQPSQGNSFDEPAFNPDDEIPF
jgi:single-strand DNA-binding protein